MCIKSSGLWTEFAAVAENMCFKIPDQMSFEEAAAIPINYVTAYHMLFDMASLKKGKSVLIHMVAGELLLRALCILNSLLFNPCKYITTGGSNYLFSFL